MRGLGLVVEPFRNQSYATISSRAEPQSWVNIEGRAISQKKMSRSGAGDSAFPRKKSGRPLGSPQYPAGRFLGIKTRGTFSFRGDLRKMVPGNLLNGSPVAVTCRLHENPYPQAERVSLSNPQQVLVSSDLETACCTANSEARFTLYCVLPS